MTAHAATLAGGRPASTLRVYRDDGPLARALGAAAGRALPGPAAALTAAGALPLFAAVAFGGAGSSRALAAAAIAWFVLAAGAAAGRPETGRLGWAAPPLLRATEYTAILWLGAIEGGAALPAAFAVLCVLSFRHYDLVYRLRHRGVTPPPWVDAAALGWEGRVILAWILLAAGALPAAFFVAAAVLAAILVGDSVAGWVRFAGEQRAGGDAGSYDDEEDEGQ